MAAGPFLVQLPDGAVRRVPPSSNLYLVLLALFATPHAADDLERPGPGTLQVTVDLGPPGRPPRAKVIWTRAYEALPLAPPHG